MKKWIIGGIAAGGIMAVLAVAAFYLVAYAILSTFIFGPPPLSPDEKKHIFEKFYHYTKHDNNVVLPVSRPYVMTRHSSGHWHLGKIRLEQSFHIVGISNQVVGMNLHKQFLIVKIVENKPGNSIYYWQIFNLAKEVDADSEHITKDNFKNKLEEFSIPASIELKPPNAFYNKLKQSKRCHWFPQTDVTTQNESLKQ